MNREPFSALARSNPKNAGIHGGRREGYMAVKGKYRALRDLFQ